jgi:hypothetical protein
MGGLKFEMTTAAGGLTLHSGPGAHLQIRMMSEPIGPFNPCTALAGQRVTAQYQPEGTDGKSGIVQNLTVLSGSGAQEDSVRHLHVGAGRKEPVNSSVEGNVKQVTCTGNELVLTLDAVDGLFTLHARDATRVPYEKDVAFDTGEFQACSQLQGHEARITFVVVDNQKYDGEIQAVEILK